MTRREQIERGWIVDLSTVIRGKATLSEKFLADPVPTSVGVWFDTYERRFQDASGWPHGASLMGELERLCQCLWVALRYCRPSPTHVRFPFDQHVQHETLGWGIIVWDAYVGVTYEEGRNCLTVFDEAAQLGLTDHMFY